MGGTGDPASGCHDEMLEAAIWIGVVLGGVAVLGVVEYVRSNSFFKAHSEEIKSNLPIFFLFLLTLITGSIAALFFFLFFLGSAWQFALAGVAAIYVFLLVRIRKEQSFGALVAQPEPSVGEQGATPRRFTRVAVLAVEAVSAALMMVFMVPLAAGGFLLFRFVKIVLETMGLTAAIWPYLFVLSVIFLTYYLVTRRRPPAS